MRDTMPKSEIDWRKLIDSDIEGLGKLEAEIEFIFWDTCEDYKKKKDELGLAQSRYAICGLGAIYVMDKLYEYFKKHNLLGYLEQKGKENENQNKKTR